MTMVRVRATAFPSAPDEPAADLPGDVIPLNGTECWRLLGRSGIGRLVITCDDDASESPITYLTHAGCVYFRSASGSALPPITPQSRVAISREGETDSAEWSVVLRGPARRLASDQDVSRSGIQRSTAWKTGEKDDYFELRPERITGRRVPPRP